MNVNPSDTGSPIRHVPFRPYSLTGPFTKDSWADWNIHRKIVEALSHQGSVTRSQHHKDVLTVVLDNKHNLILTTPPNITSFVAVNVVAVHIAHKEHAALKSDLRQADIASISGASIKTPIIRNLARGIWPSVLVVCPGKEKAEGIFQQLERLSEMSGLTFNIMKQHGKKRKLPEVELLSGEQSGNKFVPVDFVIGTPSVLASLVEKGEMHLGQTKLAVWVKGSELDRDFGMGF